MKKLLLLFALLPMGLMGQTDTSLYCVGELAHYKPAHMITIVGHGTARLNLDFAGDSMVVSGDMKLTEGAKLFIDYCQDYLETRIDSLETELKKCKTKPESIIYKGQIDSADFYVPTISGRLYYANSGSWNYSIQESTDHPTRVQTDTVAVWIDCADTTARINYNVTMRGYEIRKSTGYYWGIIDKIGSEAAIPIWEPIGYLDSFKRPLTGFLVWETKLIKQ